MVPGKKIWIWMGISGYLAGLGCAFIIYPAATSLMGYISNRQRLQDKLSSDLARSYAKMESLVAERTSDLESSREKYTNLARAAFEGIVISEQGLIVEVNTSLCLLRV